jgi:hypothetical protein
VHQEWGEFPLQPAYPGKVEKAMRRFHATKREVHMSERKLLFLMNAEQAEAFARLVEAAEAGDGGAACRLGDMCREGLGGLKFSPQQAHRWYARSALAGDAWGQNNVGACYEHGLGCTQSYVKAVKWYRLSAAQKLGTAAMNLGYCYLHGHGVPGNKSEALRLFRLAVKQGEPKAADELERLGEPVVNAEDRETPVTSRRWPEISEAAAKAVLKDDCFGVPEPGDSGYETFMADMRRFYRRHAAGVIPRLKGEPEVVMTPALEESFFDLYAHEGITPEEVAPERAERYRAFLEERAWGPPKPESIIGDEEVPDEERIRREVLEVLKCGDAEAEDEKEYFRIYAESGMKPSDFVEETAQKYAEYLVTGKREG